MAIEVRRVSCPCVEEVIDPVEVTVPDVRTVSCGPGPLGVDVFVVGDWSTTTVTRTYSFVALSALPRELSGSETVIGSAYDANFGYARVCIEHA